MMSARINLITGATGLLGSHIAQQLISRGETVKALVRPASETTFLKEIGAGLITGDLTDPRSLSSAFAGADAVFHCASRVGDFGSWKMFYDDVVQTTRNVMEAGRVAAVKRILLVSSIAVYGRRPHIPSGGLTEKQPLQPGWGDHYGRAKIMAERLARELCPHVTIVRPTWVFGPRDRHGLPRLIQAMRGGWVSIVGSGDNLLNILHADDVARGAILAATLPQAKGQTYNLCNEGDITQRRFLDALCDAEHLPRITRRFPTRLAYLGGFLSEIVARILRFQRAPHISRYTVSRLIRSTAYRIDKARGELGWSPQVRILDGLKQTME
jgi:nucleoside-diphosphate-sugar epimerase